MPEDAELIRASWKRCRDVHRLDRSAARPILRLQTSEITRRRDALTDRLSGNLSEISWLCKLATQSDHATFVTDAESTLLLQDLGHVDGRMMERLGLALGGCWNEEIAGTNGIDMALRHGREITVAGKDHYFTILSGLVCTGAPLFDHEDALLGTVSLASTDAKHLADQVFARRLLGIMTRTLQTRLFHDRFRGSVRVSLSTHDRQDIRASNALIALDTSGRLEGIIGSATHQLDARLRSKLLGCNVTELLGASIDDLVANSGTTYLAETEDGQALIVMPWLPESRKLALPGKFLPANSSPAMARKVALADFDGDPGFAAALSRARKMFRNGIPLFVTGEPGVGKLSFAQAMHFDTTLGRLPMVIIDGTNFADTPDAVERLAQQLETATHPNGNGTIEQEFSTMFLKSVDRLPLSLQLYIASFLQNLEPVLENSAPLRLIASALQNPDSAAEQGKLAHELRYQLEGEVIHLTSLRDRPDRAAVIDQMLKMLAGGTARISSAALLALSRYDWPGNYRELKMVLRRSLLLSGPNQIALGDLPVRLLGRASPEEPRASPETERASILEALESSQWNMTRAARQLRVSRATLHRKVNALGLSRPSKARLALFRPAEEVT